MSKKSFQNCFLLSTVIFSFLFIQCGETKKEIDVKLGVEVDSSKFGKFINADNLAIEFYSPLNWLQMKSEISEKNESLENKRKAKERYIYKPEFIFFNEKTRSFLSVGQVLDSSKNGKRDSLFSNYLQMLGAKYESNECVIEDIETNGVKIKQFIIKKPQIVSYKLIFQNEKGRLLQFEYTVPIEYFPDEKIAISSSVSSIRYIVKN